MTARETSEIVRADILRILWERADEVKPLKADHLSFPEHGMLLIGSARWLEAEGFIRLGKCQLYTNAPGFFSIASLTSKGEAVLQSKPEGQVSALGRLLSDAFQDAAKSSMSDAIKQAPALFMSVYQAWQSTP